MKTARIATVCAPAALLWSLLQAPAGAAPADYFKILVVDQETGRGVPLIELETTNEIVHVTDSAGVIAFLEPGLMDREVFFHVRGHGYEHAADGFGFRGVRLRPTAGGSATVKVRRLNIAERLYRVTGAGIYRDSVLLGLRAPIREPVLNGEVMGQDTVITARYGGRIYWFYGDTERASYPLGHFGAAGATSEPPGRGGLDPAQGVDLTYFKDASGFSRGVCADLGPGLKWIESAFTLPDPSGKERLLARVTCVKDLGTVLEWHLAAFDDAKQAFTSVVRWDLKDPHDTSHVFRARAGGVEYLYLQPDLRVRADWESVKRLDAYEAYTCLERGSRYAGGDSRVEHDERGRPRWTWKAGTDRLDGGRTAKLVASGKLRADEAHIRLHDVESGDPVGYFGRGSVAWNELRGRWVMIVSGKAGEVWFSEGDTPVGPWVYARCVVAHDRYNFYNPCHHPFFDAERGRQIYFEGTYTTSFSDARHATPRYEYNQVMYRLALDDPRLALPAPVYRVSGEGGREQLLAREGVEAERAWGRVVEVAFLAVPPAHAREGLIPIHASLEGGSTRLRREGVTGAKALFLALPPESAAGAGASRALVPLWEVARDGGRGPEYRAGGEPGAGAPLCRVWRNPMAVLAVDPGVEAMGEELPR